MYKIEITRHVDLYFCNEGYLFVNPFWYQGKYPPKEDLRAWHEWKYEWQLYQRDNIIQKIYNKLDRLPDRFKSEKFYQAIQF